MAELHVLLKRAEKHIYNYSKGRRPVGFLSHCVPLSKAAAIENNKFIRRSKEAVRGHEASPIRRISGKYFRPFLARELKFPFSGVLFRPVARGCDWKESSDGDRDLQIAPHTLLRRSDHYYFGDFYCHGTDEHYLTIVVCRPDTKTDR